MSTWMGRSLSACLIGALTVGLGAGCGGNQEIPLSVEGVKALPPPPQPLTDASAKKLPPGYENVIKSASGQGSMAPGAKPR